MVSLSFMGKDWDKALPPKEIWVECLRVLKPGAFAFVMCSPRQDCLARMIVNLQDAGFETGFSSLYWVYPSGFPKAGNIGKMVDKRLGAKREVVGKYKHPRSIEQGKERDNSWGEGSLDNTLEGYETQGDDKRTLEERLKITLPATPQAKVLEGSYASFNLKPAVEVILVAMKPLSEKTYVEQALANGKGITWLDDGRIPYKNQEDKESATPQGKVIRQNFAPGQGLKGGETNRPPLIGRFPANLLVSDDILNDGHNTKDGGIGGRGKHTRGEGYGFKATGKKDEKKPYIYQGKNYKVKGFISSISPQAPSNYNDVGSFSRYFSLDSWWEEKVKELPESVQKIFPFLRVPKASKSEKGFDKAVIIDIIKIWKENNIIHEAKLAQLQVITGTLPLKVTAESGTKPSAVLEWSMSWFGSNLTAKYQRDFASIISMGTGLITALQIYNWLAFLFTSEYMGDVSLQMATGGSLAENVRDSKQLVISISERMASRLGVSPVVSRIQLKISVGAKLLGHPTVKPLALMSYLITLGSRPGDIVLDPFMGSGTTCLATKILGRKTIGIEKEKAYFDIALARCKNVKMD